MKNKSLIPLSKTLEGNFCEIKTINLNKHEKERLSDLGLIPGTIIKTLQKSPLGDPTCYFIRGSVIALRRESTEKIQIEKIQT